MGAGNERGAVNEVGEAES